jgi:hypothetical protein
MSEQVGILFRDGKPLSRFESDLFSMEFDAVLTEGHSWSNDITSNPVERGVDVTDHIREIPDQITLVGFVTNTPFLEGVDTNTITDDDEDKVQAIIDRMRLIRAERSTVVIYTKYVQYKDMAIKSIDFTRDSSNTNSVIFTIQFQNIKLVETQTVDVPAGISKKLDKKSGDAVKKKTEPQKAGGAKQPKEPEKASSVLSNTLPKLKDFILGKQPTIPGS